MSILQIFIGVVLVAEGLFVWRYGRKQLGMVLAVNAGAVLWSAPEHLPRRAARGLGIYAAVRLRSGQRQSRSSTRG